MCRPIDSVRAVRPDRPDLRGGCLCCCGCPGPEELAGVAGLRRVRVKKLLHFVKNLRRGATSKTIDEKPWWKMLALHSGMERLRLEAGVGAGRSERQAHSAHSRRTVDCAVDRAVRLAAVSTDLQLDMPPSIALPDGEEYPYGASARLHIRDPEQESEIYQKCIRPPPNRTVFDGESPPPYRSSSVSGGGGGGCGSGSAILRYPHAAHPAHPGSALGPPLAPAGLGLPAVIVPSPPRKQDAVATPALFLAGPAATGKHSTVSTPCSTAAGLVRLLTPSPSAAERAPTVKPKAGVASRASASATGCRTASSAAPSSAAAPSASASADLVDVTSASCSPTARDIPAVARGSSGLLAGGHLAGLTMVPCLAESRTETTSTNPCPTAARASAPAARVQPSPLVGDAPSPARTPTRTRSGEEQLARPLPRPPV